jgi:hypothetical protein
VPPVALASAATKPRSSTPASRPLPVTQPTDHACEGACIEPAPVARRAARPHLHLVPAGPEPGEVVHGRGGPPSCGCRACAMARHPAAMPRLTVVR